MTHNKVQNNLRVKAAKMTDNNTNPAFNAAVSEIIENLQSKPNFVQFQENLKNSMTKALNDRVGPTPDDAVSEVITNLATEILAESLAKLMNAYMDQILNADRELFTGLQGLGAFQKHMIENLDLKVENSEGVSSTVSALENPNLDSESLTYLLTFYAGKVNELLESLEKVTLEVQGGDKPHFLQPLFLFTNAKLSTANSFVELLASNPAATDYWLKNDKQTLIGIMKKITSTVAMTQIAFGLIATVSEEINAAIYTDINTVRPS